MSKCRFYLSEVFAFISLHIGCCRQAQRLKCILKHILRLIFIESICSRIGFRIIQFIGLNAELVSLGKGFRFYYKKYDFSEHEIGYRNSL